jgi:hypothetical protein
MFLLMIHRGAALAILLGVLVCPQISCLIPQDIEPTNTGPHGGVPAFQVESFPPYLLPPILTLTRRERRTSRSPALPLPAGFTTG